MLRAAAFALVILDGSSAAAQVLPPRSPPPEPITFDVGARGGAAFRLGSSSSVPIAAREGGMLGLGASIAPSRRFAVGLAYEHGWLGTEKGSGAYGTADIARSLDTMWATIRLALYFDDHVSFGVLLGPGVAWQTAHLEGAVSTAGGPSPLTCNENRFGPDVGLRAGIGSEIKLGQRWVVALDMVVDELRLSSDALGGCVAGAGSTSVFGARAGFSYRFDVSRALR